MRLKSVLVFLSAIMVSTALAGAADVPDAVQKALYANYELGCAAALDPSDPNVAAFEGTLAPAFVAVDTKGKETKRDEVIANFKQQMKVLHATACDSKFESVTAPDANTLVAVNTLHVAGELQAPDGKHDFDFTNKTQDTWTLVGGKWLETNGKDLRVLVKIDGNVVQDQGS
jgi:hypothetical protein